VLAAIVLATIFYVWPLVMVSREMGATAYLYALLLLLAVRFFFLRHVDENVFRHRTLVFGAGHRANAIGDLRRKADRRGFKIVGSVPAPGDSQVLEINGLLIKDKPVDWLAEEMGADEIVIAMDDRRGNLPIRELLNCKLRGIEVIDILEFLERESGKIRIDLVNPGWLIFSHGFRISRFRRVIKRIVDLVVGSAIVLVTWPFMLMISLAIKIEDGMRAPVLYRQSRVGYRGEQFDVLKFRSMREDAEADGKAVWAEENDERVTRVGYCLRKFRLDEIPQAFNVISGQMSLVGPRPERPEFVGHLSETVPYYSERHTVKPGVTGWAQIHCPYGASEEDAVEKLQYDLYYVKNHNIFLDLIIILQTVEVVLWGKGSR
jgi:sugar transferase (PEP-CTERM system associated)